MATKNETAVAPKAAPKARATRAKASAKAKVERAPTATAAAVKAEVKPAEPKMLSAMGTESRGAPYEVFKGAGSNEAFSGFTLAAFIVSECASMSAAGVFTRKAGGSLALWRALVGKRAPGYWRDNGLIDGQGLTPEGVVKAQNRLNGQTAYKTTKEAVSALLAAMRSDKPCKVKVSTSKGDVIVPMGAKVAVSK